MDVLGSCGKLWRDTIPHRRAIIAGTRRSHRSKRQVPTCLVKHCRSHARTGRREQAAASGARVKQVAREHLSSLCALDCCGRAHTSSHQSRHMVQGTIASLVHISAAPSCSPATRLRWSAWAGHRSPQRLNKSRTYIWSWLCTR